MQPTSSLYNRINAESHYVEYKLNINGTDVPASAVQSMSLTGSLYTDYGIGNCNLRQANITVEGIYNTGVPLIVYARLVSNVDGEVSEWLRYCTLEIFSREVVENTYTEIQAYDKLCETEYKYKRQPTWEDTTMPVVVAGICSDIGVTLTAHAQGLIPNYRVADPNNMTAREILQNIAVAAAGNWYTTADGALDLKRITVPSYTYSIDADDIEKDTFKQKQTYSHFVGVELEGQSLVYRAPAGLDENEWEELKTTGRIMEAHCEWATQEIANSILSIIANTTQYKPWRATVNLDIAAELGDGVLVQGAESVFAEYSLRADGGRLSGEIAGPGTSNVEYMNPYTPEVKRKIAAEADYRRASITVLDNRITSEVSELDSEIGELSTTVTQTVSGLEVLTESAGSRDQIVYRSAASGTSSMSKTTTWVTDTTGGQNKWTSVRPEYSQSYPVLFVAIQRQTVKQQQQGTTCTCTTPVIDKTTTVIDGGHIITGTVSATQMAANAITADKIATGAVGLNQLSNDVQTTINTASADASAAQAAVGGANSREQYIYISKPVGTTSVSANTTWVTATTDTQNAWRTRRPTYNSSYPVVFIAKQSQTVAQQAAGTTCDCTTPVIDNTTTVIDGGNIITGTITASQIAGNSITLSNLDTSTQTAINNGAAAYDRANASRGTCGNGWNVADRTVTSAGFVLTTGAAITVRFASGNNVADALTLNVNSTGAKSIRVAGAITSTSNHLLWGNGTCITFVYNGTAWVVEETPGTYRCGTCSTAASTAAKSATCDSIIICKGTRISVPMTYANTNTSATLNIANTGAKNIYYGTGTTAPTTANGYGWLGGQTADFEFDGAYWRLKTNGTIINGDHIITGSINADLITTGTLKAITIQDTGDDPQNIWNLSTGEFETNKGKIGKFSISGGILTNGDTSARGAGTGDAISIATNSILIANDDTNYYNGRQAILINEKGLSIRSPYQSGSWGWVEFGALHWIEATDPDDNTKKQVFEIQTKSQLTDTAAIQIWENGGAPKIKLKDYVTVGTRLTVNGSAYINGYLFLDSSIYSAGPLSVSNTGKVTSGSASNFKTKQTAKSDPTASGTGIEYISSITQNANGEITATKSTVRSASTGQSGVVTTGNQEFLGVKKFSYRPVVKSLDGNAGIEFQSNNNERMGLFYQGGGSGRFYFQEYSKTDGVLTNYYENYQLPQPDNNLTSNPTYNILTSKNPVTVTQGGTGATTVDGARENLNIFRSLGALTDANNTNLFGSTLRQANTCANLPTSAAGTYYFLMCFGNSQLALRFTSTGADRLYARYHTNSKWYDWKGVALS